MAFFQFLSLGVLATFFGIMIGVTITAYNRPSGSTGQTMAQIQELRHKPVEKRG